MDEVQSKRGVLKDKGQSGRCNVTVVDNERLSTVARAEIRLRDDLQNIYGPDALPELANHTTRFLDGTAHQGAVAPEAIIMQEHERRFEFRRLCSHRLGLDRGSLPSHRGELGAQSDTAPQIRS